MLVKSASITTALISHLTSFLTLDLFTDLISSILFKLMLFMSVCWFIIAYDTVLFTQCKGYILTI